jgi:hypothetical protein
MPTNSPYLDFALYSLDAVRREIEGNFVNGLPNKTVFPPDDIPVHHQSEVKTASSRKLKAGFNSKNNSNHSITFT